MAHLWIRETDDWTPVTLVGEEVDLAGNRLVAAGGSWLLLVADPRTRVNGAPVPGAVRLLRDRDEITGGSTRPVYFSTERLANVGPMPDLGREVICPRCRRPITPGDPAVECPGCGLFHHQRPDRSCWSYAAVCGSCPQPTGDVGYRWNPEALVG